MNLFAQTKLVSIPRVKKRALVAAGDLTTIGEITPAAIERISRQRGVGERTCIELMAIRQAALADLPKSTIAAGGVRLALRIKSLLTPPPPKKVPLRRIDKAAQVQALAEKCMTEGVSLGMALQDPVNKETVKELLANLDTILRKIKRLTK
jgi:hypothetical protein